MSAFSATAIRHEYDSLYSVADRLVDQLKQEKAASLGRPVDIYHKFRALALDSVSPHMFGPSYMAQEEGEDLSAVPYIDMFAILGRFYYWPQWLFKLVTKFLEYCFPDHEVDTSINAVNSYVEQRIDEAGKNDQTFQSRLLAAGFSRTEIITQCTDIIFAGVESSGLIMATICCELAKSKDQ